MKKSYIFLFQWLIIACIAGITGSITIHIFLAFYGCLSGFLRSVNAVPVFIWPVAGAAVVSLLIYRIEPRAKGEGMPSYIISLRERGGEMSVSETFFKFWAALLTLGTFGNGGFLGPGGRVSAGIMSALYRIIPDKIVSAEHKPLFPICGLAAAFGALVHSPIGAGIFAVEIMQKSSMRYRQLFPAILASTVSVYTSRFFGFKPMFSLNAVGGLIDLRIAGIILLLSVAAGFAGRGFTLLYALVSRMFHRDHKLSHCGVAVRAVIGSTAAFFAVYFLNPALAGTSPDIFRAVFEGDFNLLYGNISNSAPLFLVIILLMILKAAANSLTVGSGMSAGFAGPSMLIGLLAGAAFASFFGISADTPDYFALLAAGFAGVFSSTMNTPIAVSVLTIELFGMYYSLPAGLAAVIGFQVNRHHTLYDMVFEEEDDN